MSKAHSEEKSPLLNIDDSLKTRKRIPFEGKRYRDVSFGATTVLTHFPNFIGTCWITTAFCGLIFFMMMLLLISAITSYTLRIPKCVAGEELNSRTIHLVHPYENGKWKQMELDIFSKIIRTYRDFKIHLILVQDPIKKNSKNGKYTPNETEVTKKPNTTTGLLITSEHQNILKNKEKYARRKRRKANDYHFSENMEAKKLLDILLNGKLPEPTENYKSTVSTVITNSNGTDKLPSIQTTNTIFKKTVINTLGDLLKSYPNITVENTTYNKIFFNSPLYPYWPDLTENFRIFAIRILELWQYGGISFELQPSLINRENISEERQSNSTNKNYNSIYNTEVMKFIIIEKKRFDSLADNVVAADDEGLHMESKVPCHAFFGEVLMNFKKWRNYSSIRDIIKSSVSVFCKHYAAKKEYCNSLDVYE